MYSQFVRNVFVGLLILYAIFATANPGKVEAAIVQFTQDIEGTFALELEIDDGEIAVTGCEITIEEID